MASALTYALCIALCIFSLQTGVLAHKEKIKEKIVLTVYVHEIRGGPTSTILAAAGTGQGNFSALGWGSLLVSENILKAGTSVNSLTLGRVTGSGLLSTKGGFADGGVQVSNKFWFSPTSKYKGSSITVLGTLAYPLPPWELTAVAGTGHFRGYYGYVLASSEPAATVANRFVAKFTFNLFKIY